jgi:hypothetical protein
MEQKMTAETPITYVTADEARVVGDGKGTDLMQWFWNWYDARRRRIDLDILWPVCKEHARDLDQAKAAFAIHAFNDPPWLSLGEDEIKRRIDELE